MFRPDISSEVLRYKEGCKLVERELLILDNSTIIRDVIECLMVVAYSKIPLMDFVLAQMMDCTTP